MVCHLWTWIARHTFFVRIGSYKVAIRSRTRFWWVSGIVISSLLTTACARSPANPDQQLWVWRQGPGNLEEVGRRLSTEPQTTEPSQILRSNEKDAGSTIEPGPNASDNNRYTQAVLYENQLYVSGQIPIDLKSLKLVGETVEEQTQTVMDNIQIILNDNGMSMSNIVFVTLYLKEINDLGSVDGIYETYFHRTLPARTVVAVAGLPRGSRLEISVIAGR